ncbi:hypothetical protein LQ318_01275 [Aliifodinibius salicampi]|uniref:Hydrolase n=1 Tax=Fodinibius salicampi TaxID=1920655 RepID=A0ABT3PUI3_9BACT|nr:hypothetical protein [Fodinibius salicampi]MCW9711521.1 hypothetical protein [Fodinibius salicampi]
MAKRNLTYRRFFLLLLFFGVIPTITFAQETDTTRQEIEPEQEERKLNMQSKFDRSMSGGIMSEMGSYEVPSETEYYTPPFKGQEYLDMAVEAYRKELERSIGPDWMWQFMKTVAPYINNQFEFGVYQIYDLPIVDRDNPLFQSDSNNKKRE